MSGPSSLGPVRSWRRRLGVGAALFFTIKGLVWVAAAAWLSGVAS